MNTQLSEIPNSSSPQKKTIYLPKLDLTNLISDTFPERINEYRYELGTYKKISGVGCLPPHDRDAVILLPIYLKERERKGEDESHFHITLEMQHTNLYVRFVRNIVGNRFLINKGANEKEEFVPTGSFIPLPADIKVDYTSLFAATRSGENSSTWDEEWNKNSSTWDENWIKNSSGGWDAFEQVRTDLSAIKMAVKQLSVLSKTQEGAFSISTSDLASFLLSILIGVVEPIRSNSVEMRVRRSIAVGLAENLSFLPLHHNEWTEQKGMKTIILGWGNSSYVLRRFSALLEEEEAKIEKGEGTGDIDTEKTKLKTRLTTYMRNKKMFNYGFEQLETLEQVFYETGLIKSKGKTYGY